MTNKLKDNCIVYACVLVGIMILALAARGVALGVGVDNFIATCTFWITVLLTITIYFIFERVLEKGISLLVVRHLKRNSISSREQLVESFINYTVPEPTPTPMLNLREIREANAEKLKNEFQEQIDTANLYTQRTLAPYVSDEAMADMLHNINIYATKGDFSELREIRTNGLQYYDLFHYGWNIWNHFGVKHKQSTMTNFLKAVFPNELKNFDTLEGITRKLKMYVPNDRIKICEKLDKNTWEQ